MKIKRIIPLLACSLVATAIVVAQELEQSIETALKVSWLTERNKSYRIFSSTDLESWDVAVNSIPGDGKRMVRFFEREATATYYRVEEVDEVPWLDGNWSGRMDQLDLNDEITATLRTDFANNKHTIDYDGHCTGDLEIESIEEDRIVFSEVIEDAGGCTSEGLITIERLDRHDEDTIMFFWQYPEHLEHLKPVYAFSVMTRE